MFGSAVPAAAEFPSLASADNPWTRELDALISTTHHNLSRASTAASADAASFSHDFADLDVSATNGSFGGADPESAPAPSSFSSAAPWGPYPDPPRRAAAPPPPVVPSFVARRGVGAGAGVGVGAGVGALGVGSGSDGLAEPPGYHKHTLNAMVDQLTDAVKFEVGTRTTTLERHIADLQASVRAEQGQFGQLRSASKDSERRQRELAVGVERLEQDVAAVCATVDGVRASVDDVTRQRADTVAKVDDLQATVADVQGQVAGVKKAMQMYVTRDELSELIAAALDPLAARMQVRQCDVCSATFPF